MSERKYLRIALTAQDFSALLRAKEIAESKAGIEMSESLFALSVLRRAIKEINSE